MLYRSFSWQLRYIFCPWLAFRLVEESPSLRLWPSQSRYGFSSQCSTVSNFLGQGPPSLQGFPAFFIKPGVWFLGDGGCPWDAVICGLVLCSMKKCEGSASSSISSEMLSKHTSWNCSQLALENTQWEGSQLGCISATDGRIEVSMG